MALALLAVTALPSIVTAAETGEFLSWLFRVHGNLANRPTGYLYGPENGYGNFLPADVNAEAAAGRKATILVRWRDETSPAPTTTLATFLSQVTKLDYVMADLEGSDVASHNAWLISTVRSAISANVKNAFIGNYGQMPGTYDASVWSVNGRDTTARDTRYHAAGPNGSAGLQIAMPIAYPYSYYTYHVSSSIQGANVCPNARSAYFWAPLEHVSTAARALPSGHKLIPWIVDFNDFLNQTTLMPYIVPVNQFPTVADNESSVQHYRLRGADGYYVWAYGNVKKPMPQAHNYNVAWQNYTGGRDYEDKMRLAWNALDTAIDATKVNSILNLGTNKVSGVQWSGVRSGNSIKLLVSNLNTTAQTANIQTDANAQVPKTWFRGMPTTISQTASTHTLSTTYTIANLLADGPMTTAPPTYWSPWSAAAVYSTTGGSGNSSCYKLTGPAAGAATVAGEKIRVEPGAAMNVSVWAKSNTAGAKLMVNFYLLNSAGAVITTSGASTTVRAFPNGVLPTTTGGTLTNTAMPIPATAGSPAQVPYYIQPLLQNGSPSTVITVDDMVVKFE